MKMTKTLCIDIIEQNKFRSNANGIYNLDAVHSMTSGMS